MAERIVNGRYEQEVYAPGEYKGEVVHWKSVTEAHQMALTDDGYVLEVLAVRRFKGVVRKLKFVFGEIWCKYAASSTRKFLWEEQRKQKVVTWLDLEVRKGRLKRAVQAYVGMQIGHKPIDWLRIGQIYRPEQKDPAMTARRVFRYQQVRDMITSEMKRALQDHKIDPDYILERMKEVVERARATSDLANMRLQLKDLADMLDMYPKKAAFDQFDPARLPTAEATYLLDDEEEEQASRAARNILGEPQNGNES